MTAYTIILTCGCLLLLGVSIAVISASMLSSQLSKEQPHIPYLYPLDTAVSFDGGSGTVQGYTQRPENYRLTVTGLILEMPNGTYRTIGLEQIKNVH